MKRLLLRNPVPASDKLSDPVPPDLERQFPHRGLVVQREIEDEGFRLDEIPVEEPPITRIR